VTFPATTVGATSDPVTITITANSATTIGVPFFNVDQDSTDYAIVPGTCTQGTALAAGQSCTFQVQFQPTMVSPPNSFVIIDYGLPFVTGAITVGLGNQANPPPNIPEVGLPILLPLAFTGLLATIILWRRRQTTTTVGGV
jgi:hypothetical protein